MSRLLSTIAIVFVTGVSVSEAAPLEVDNPDMHAVTGNGLNIMAHISGVGEVIVMACSNEWEANTSANGHMNFHNIYIDPPGTGNCSNVNDCDDLGWEGQLVSADSVHFEFCLEGLVGSDVSGEVACFLEDGQAEMHCDDEMVEELSGVGVPPLELEGELALDPTVEIEGGTETLTPDATTINWAHSFDNPRELTLENASSYVVLVIEPMLSGKGKKRFEVDNGCNGQLLQPDETCMVLITKHAGNEDHRAKLRFELVENGRNILSYATVNLIE